MHIHKVGKFVSCLHFRNLRILTQWHISYMFTGPANVYWPVDLGFRQPGPVFTPGLRFLLLLIMLLPKSVSILDYC